MKTTDDMSTEERVEFWTMALGELKSSGLSKAEFCRQNGFKTSTLNYWQRRLDGRQTETAAATRFIELDPAVLRPDGGRDSRRGTPVPFTAQLSVLCGGVSILVGRDTPMELLAQVIGVLRDAT